MWVFARWAQNLKRSKNAKALRRKLHLGRLDLLVAAESADPAPPELDGAVLELIRDKPRQILKLSRESKKPRRPLRQKSKECDDGGDGEVEKWLLCYSYLCFLFFVFDN